MKPQSHSNPEDQARVPGNEIAPDPSKTGQSEPIDRYKGSTPGPWDAICDSPRAPSRQRMALVATDVGTRAADFTGSGKTYAADCANARLAADAPMLLAQRNELLAKLEELTGQCEDCGYAENYTPSARALIARIKESS